MKRGSLLFTAVLLMATAHAQQWYAGIGVAPGNGSDLGSSYANLELGHTFGSLAVGAAVGRDLATPECEDLYFVELRGTQMLELFGDGPQPYVCGGVGQYLDGRWVNEFGAGLSWPSGISVGACSFGGAGYLTLTYTFLP